MHNNIDIPTTKEATPVAELKKSVVKGAKEGINSVRLSRNDQDIIDFMSDKGAFSSYVKKLIRAEIEREKALTAESEFEDLNDKLNQILDLLQNTTVISNVESIDDSPVEEQEVYNNPNARTLSGGFSSLIK